MSRMYYTCCKCKRECLGFGNNPFGILDSNGKPVVWESDDRCCDECNGMYVVPGRIKLLFERERRSKVEEGN